MCKQYQVVNSNQLIACTFEITTAFDEIFLHDPEKLQSDATHCDDKTKFFLNEY